jgi:tetratricopeptide (TPR) repeat protein
LHLSGVIALQCGDHLAAVRWIGRAIASKPDVADYHSNLGAALHALGRLEPAAAAFTKAIGLNSPRVETHHNLGVVLREVGRADEALTAFQGAIRLRPDQGEAHYNVGLLGGKTDISLMEAIHGMPGLSAKDRTLFCFALGKAYEDLGQVEKSFGFYAEGNALRKAELGYAAARDRSLFDRIRQHYSVPPAANEIPASRPRPVFIVGMPRSGTSLVEQILASHSDVFGAGELMAMSEAVRLDFSPERIRAEYGAALAMLETGRPVVTDKMPLNFRWIGAIFEAFPDAKVVHLRRDPVAVCWSIFKHYFPAADLGFAYDLQDLAEYYRLYLDLMQFWRLRYPGRIHDLDYQKLTEDPEAEARVLLSYCGLDWEPGVLDFHRNPRPVQTASAVQVRTAIYRGSSDQWKRFEAQLQPLVEALRPDAARRG